MTETVTILIRPDGTVEAEALNMTGPGCAEAVKTLLREARVTGGRHKDEYYQQPLGQQQHIGG